MSPSELKDVDRFYNGSCSFSFRGCNFRGVIKSIILAPFGAGLPRISLARLQDDKDGGEIHTREWQLFDVPIAGNLDIVCENRQILIFQCQKPPSGYGDTFTLTAV